MDRYQKYAKAKIDQPNSRLPKFLQKWSVSADDLSFMRIFEDDDNKGQRIAEAAASGVKTARKVYRVRNKDLLDVLGKDCKNMQDIHRLSNATIALLADAECDFQSHSYIDLVGTVDQIKTAEELILDIILKIYDDSVFPVILMPPTIDGQQITMPLYKVGLLIGPNGCNIVKLEMESGAWIMIDNGPLGGSALDRVVKVYGPRENVIKAFSLIKSAIHQTGESSEVEKKIEEVFEKLKCESEKELKIELDKYAKAKIEEPNLRLPKALLKPNTDPTTGDIYYKNIFEEDTKKFQHLKEAVDAGAKADRKVYRIRDKELDKACGKDNEEIQNIHRVSKSTVGLLTDPESKLASQSFIDLIGTVDQVRTAENLILDKILKTYNGPTFPIILMPPTVYWHKRKLPLHKIERLIGENCGNILAMEIVSGAWIEIDYDTLPGGSQMERYVNVYGPRAHVTTALSLINSAIYEPGECIDAERELEQLFKELTFDEMMRGMKPRFKELEQIESRQAEESKHKKEKQQVEGGASGSSSGQTDDQQKQQQVEEA